MAAALVVWLATMAGVLALIREFTNAFPGFQSQKLSITEEILQDQQAGWKLRLQNTEFVFDAPESEGWQVPEYTGPENKRRSAWAWLHREAPDDVLRILCPDAKCRPETDTNRHHGIYLSGSSARMAAIEPFISLSRKSSATALVFDIKDVTGFVNHRSVLPQVKQTQGKPVPPISSLREVTWHLRKNNLYSIARVTLFQDERLAAVAPGLAIRKANGTPVFAKGRVAWVDPSRPEVQEYNLLVIREALESGVDEIQLDYVRYPAEGDWKDGVHFGISAHEQKPATITRFLQRVHSLVRSYNARLSLDVFGVVAWKEAPDIRSTGQDLRYLHQAADVLSPMLYPSHFGLQFGSFRNPADHPYPLVKEGIERLRKIAPGKSIRPWIQAFPWRVTNYGPAYVQDQIRAAKDAGSFGFLLWNAGNRYSVYQP